MATERNPVDYVVVSFDTSKKLKAAQAAYDQAYKAMKLADAARKELKAAEMIAKGLIPEGTMPVFSVRKWDGVLQVLRDQASGEFLHAAPKASKGKATDQV